MSTIQITLDDSLHEFLEITANKNGFASTSDYVESVLANLRENEKERGNLEALLLEGVRSPTVPGDEAFWLERRRKVLERDPGITT